MDAGVQRHLLSSVRVGGRGTRPTRRRTSLTWVCGARSF